MFNKGNIKSFILQIWNLERRLWEQIIRFISPFGFEIRSNFDDETYELKFDSVRAYDRCICLYFFEELVKISENQIREFIFFEGLLVSNIALSSRILGS